VINPNPTEAHTEEPDDDELRRGDVAFTVRPKLVMNEDGPTIKFELGYKVRATVDVGFRLSWKGRPMVRPNHHPHPDVVIARPEHTRAATAVSSTSRSGHLRAVTSLVTARLGVFDMGGSRLGDRDRPARGSIIGEGVAR
jgi:hypothetical protein